MGNAPVRHKGASPHQASLPVDVVWSQTWGLWNSRSPAKGRLASGRDVGEQLRQEQVFLHPDLVLVLLCESSLLQSHSTPWELLPAWKLSPVAPFSPRSLPGWQRSDASTCPAPRLKEQYGLSTSGWVPLHTCISWGGGKLEGQDVVKQTQASWLSGSRRREAIKRVASHCVAWEFSLGRRLESPETPQDRFKEEKGHAWDAVLLSEVPVSKCPRCFLGCEVLGLFTTSGVLWACPPGGG